MTQFLRQAERPYLESGGLGPERIVIETTLSIGRIPSNALALNDAGVSRRHALITAQGSREFWLVDLGSANGTFLNGRRLFQPRRLHDSDQISIGPFRFTFRLGRAADVTPHADALSDALTPPSVSSAVRLRLFPKASQTTKDVCYDLLRALDQNQLVFCFVDAESGLPSELLKPDSTAVQLLQTKYRHVIALDARNGCDEKGSFSIEQFYAYVFKQMLAVFGLTVPDAHHDQDIIQILRDEPDVLLCLLHLDVVPLGIATRLRGLTQERQRNLVILQASRPDLERQLIETTFFGSEDFGTP